jgi:hypothetical protein
MPSEPTSKSRSHVQTEAEIEILDPLGQDLGLTFVRSPGRIDVAPAYVNVDGATPDGSVLVEAYARQGKLKGAQPKKVAQDILKFALVKREAGQQNVRTIIAFASAEAHKSIAGWVKQAAVEFGVELHVVNIQPELRAEILRVQGLQVMVNKAADVIE